jgi:hypothetical protein
MGYLVLTPSPAGSIKPRASKLEGVLAHRVSRWELTGGYFAALEERGRYGAPGVPSPTYVGGGKGNLTGLM